MARPGEAIETEDFPAAPERNPGFRRFVAFAPAPDRAGDGPCEEGLEAQMQRAWLNLFDVMKAAGYEKRHLVRTTVSVTEGGHLDLYRQVRDRMLQGHAAPSSYLHVPHLREPAHLVEIEAEAVKR